jgi:hypothetical protein
MSRRGFVIATMFVAGCTADAPSSADADSEADVEDSADVNALEQLVAANTEPDTTQSITLENVGTLDADEDGIPDVTEEALLRRYRPFYKFSQDSNGNDESFRPANPIDILTDSQLKISYPNGGGTSDPLSGCGRSGDSHLDPPEQLFTCRTDTSFLVANQKTEYSLNIANADYHGVDFATAISDATGLYGHVAPTTINGHNAYKIEYWQFFGFNDQNISVLWDDSFGDHEGDWTSVQLWFDLEEHRIVQVRYLIHGKKAEFDLAPSTPSCTDCMVVMHGPNYDPNPPNFLTDQAPYSNNSAQFYIDDHHYKHPVVYIERGAHEFWPGPWGHAQVDVGPFAFHLNPHNGAGPSYLVPAPTFRIFNMGEVDHALTRAGRFLMRFDGFWGSTNTHEVGFWGPVQRSPVGPELHCSWRWPDGKSAPGCEG